MLIKTAVFVALTFFTYSNTHAQSADILNNNQAFTVSNTQGFQQILNKILDLALLVVDEFISFIRVVIAKLIQGIKTLWDLLKTWYDAI